MFMKTRYDSSRDEVDESEETERQTFKSSFESMDLSPKCLNPVERNMMMVDSDFKIEITTNEDNIYSIGPFGHNADGKEEPASQTDPDIDKVPQALEITVKQDKTYNCDVNWVSGDTGTLEEINNGVNLTYRNTGEAASQTNPYTDREQQDLQGFVKQEEIDDCGADTLKQEKTDGNEAILTSSDTVKQEKIDGLGVNLTYVVNGTQEEVDEVNLSSRNTVKQEKTNGGEEKNTNKTEITSVPLSSNKTCVKRIENGKLKDSGMLLSTTKKIEKLTGKNKVSPCYKKPKNSQKKVTAHESKTSDKKLPEKSKRTVNKNVTNGHKIKIAQEKQRRDKNVLMRKFICEQCDKTFCNQYNLKRHRDSVHLKMKQKCDGPKKYYCKQEGCNKVFSNSSNYKKHYNAVHLNIRQHLCEICSFMFKTKSALKSHFNTLHEKDQQIVRIFECKQCQKKFTTNAKLKIHETVHTDLKPFTCNYEDCGKTFRLKQNLTNHMNVHLCIKPHVCPTCNQAFSRRIYLETHQYKHTGEKKYQCSVCDKRFSQQGNLNVHMKSHRNSEKDLNPT